MLADPAKWNVNPSLELRTISRGDRRAFAAGRENCGPESGVMAPIAGADNGDGGAGRTTGDGALASDAFVQRSTPDCENVRDPA